MIRHQEANALEPSVCRYAGRGSGGPEVLNATTDHRPAESGIE